MTTRYSMAAPRRSHGNRGQIFRTILVFWVVWLTAGWLARPALAQPSTSPPWWERIRFSGDFRSRYEGFYEEDHHARHRVRLRLRLRFDMAINPDTSFQVQLASGDPGTPVSTNQTFTEYFRPKPFNLDVAALQYTPSRAPALTLGLGKFTLPFARTQMLWDDDLNLEGGFQQVVFGVGEAAHIKLGAIETVINEVSATEDAFMLGGYGELTVDLGDHELRVSATDYGFGRVDQIAVATATGALDSINTNAIERDASGRVIGFLSDFNLVDIIGELTLATGRPGYPVQILTDWVRNTRAVGGLETGFWTEFKYGDPRARQSYGVSYTVARIQQDAVLSPFVFSDTPGSGIDIHMIESSYVPLDNVSLDFTLHITRPLDAAAGRQRTWLFRPHVAVVGRF